MRLRLAAFLLLVSLLTAPAVERAFPATLEQLSLPEMIRRSTAIVRGRVLETGAVLQGPLIYTQVRFEVAEQWKGESAKEIDIYLPGGKVGSVQQRFSGTPRLPRGKEFVVFLWTGPSGRTQITGLSQGLFEVIRDPRGEIEIVRKPNADLMLEPSSGRPVQYPTIRLPLQQLVTQIQSLLGVGGTEP